MKGYEIMKKCFCFICLLIVAFQFSVFPAFASGITFKEVIDEINSISYDGNKTFLLDEVTTFRGPDPNDFFTMKGAALMWMTDKNYGDFYLFNRDNDKQVCVWQRVEKKHYDRVMDDLIKILSDYIDFNDGGKITFIITTDKNFTKPSVQLEYSTVPGKKTSNYFTDPDQFCESVREAVYSTFLPK